jgi:hypothetical protein
MSALALLSGCNTTQVDEKAVSIEKDMEAEEDKEPSKIQIITTYLDKVNSGLTPLSQNLEDAVEVIGMGMKDHELTYS